MSYKYCKIYNVSKSEWAYNVSGNDDADKIWEDNEWDENDALVGFYSDDTGNFHNVIFCQPGYAVFVQGEDEKEKANFEFEDETIRIPPAILVNLNDAYDTEFLHNKVHPSDMDIDDDDCECDCHEDEDMNNEDDSDEDDEDSDEDEDEDEDEDDEDSDEDKNIPRKYPTLFARCSENDGLIPLLQKCRANTDNVYKKKAYTRAIIEVISINYVLNIDSVYNLEVGESIKRKISDYLYGIPEEDIINS
jgi:hypothetical protein